MAHYNDELSAEDQIQMEESIASVVFSAMYSDEDDENKGGEDACAEAGRQILRMVLERFRPDLFEGHKQSRPTDGEIEQFKEKALACSDALSLTSYDAHFADGVATALEWVLGGEAPVIQEMAEEGQQ